MASYLCQSCTINNNGWCPKKQMNGLKKLGFTKPDDCNDYNGNEKADTLVTFRKGEDGLKQPHLTIAINNAIAFIPTTIVEEFLKGNSREITITIPGDE